MNFPHIQTNNNNQRGAVVMYAVIVISIGAIAALAVLSKAGIDAFVDADNQVAAYDLRHELMGCKDELLIQYSVDETYNPSQIDTGSAVCSVSITSPTTDTREAVLTRSRDNVTRGLRVEFEVEPVVVTRVIDTYN
jgi:hypothetical protein